MTRAIPTGFLLLLVAASAAAQPLPSAIALLLGAREFAVRETERRPDPVPLRRVWLAPGAPTPAAPDGDPFQRMTREEFERLVQSAARNAPVVPKLIRAEYRGALVDDALAGTADWQFAADGPGAFPLDTLKLAVRGMKWSDGSDAALYGVPAKLWLERGGRSAATFAWSARGAEEPGQIRFQLGVPAAPLATFELELPADRIPTAKTGTFLAGPSTRPGGRAAWRFAFGGESMLEVIVRQPAGARPLPVVSFQRLAKFDLSPGLAALACEFEATALRDAPTTLAFTLDAGMSVTDVTAAGLASWKAESNRLTLAFREPFPGGRIAIAAAAAFPADGQPWTPPVPRPADAPLAGDQIELLIAPELKWEGLAPGDYRPVRASTNERGYLVGLRGALPADAAAPRRLPVLRARGTAAEFATIETMDWRIDARRTVLTARYRAAVARGPLARLTVRVPAALTPVAATLTPDDPTVVLVPLGGELWAIEPTQPVPTGETLDVRLELRGPAPRFVDTRATLTLANPSPLGAGRRDGTLTVQLAADLRGWTTRSEGEFSEGGLATLKYMRDEPFALVVAIRRAAGTEPPEPPRPKPTSKNWQYADLETEASIEPDGTARVELRGRIRSAKDRELSIGLPIGAAVESIRVAGKWVDAPIGERVRLPVPEPGADGVPFLVHYRLAPVAGWPSRAGDFRPDLPDAPSIRTTVIAGPHHRAWPSLAETATPGAPLLPAFGLRAVGFGFAALVFGFGVVPALRRSVGRFGRGLAFLVVAGLGLAAWLAPPGWTIVVAPPLAVAILAWLAMQLRPRAAVAAVVVASTFATGSAQAPAVATVYFAADADRLLVLAPRSTLQRLADLAAPHRPAVLLVDAEYAGTEADGAMRFEATWRLSVARPGVHEFELPLAGVRLERMTLDGAPAFPDAAKPGRYKVAVSGVGPRVLGAIFTVPSSETATGREVRCGIPEHPGSRVVLALPADGRVPELVGRTGARALAATAGRNEMRADLGAGGSLAIRWRDATAAPPAVTAQDATVWTVNESRAEALVAFLHRVERGSLTRLVFDLPAGLDAGAFAVRELDAPDDNGLKDWSIETTPAGTRLALALRQPARGTLVTTFRLVPRAGHSARPALVVPRTATGETTASHLGVRLVGVVADSWQNEHLIDLPADAVAREFAAVPELEFDRTLARSLRREGANPPVARPLLRGPTTPAATVHELVWSLGSRAEIAGTALGAGFAAPAVECDLPPGVTVTDVAAGDLAGWEQAGNRLRVWFKSDTRDPSVKWYGSWPAYAAGTTFELPGVPGTTVRVRPVEGVAIAVSNFAAVKWLATPRPRERAWANVGPNPVPKFQVHPAAAPIATRTDTLARDGNAFEHRAVLEAPLTANRPHAFALAVSNLPAGAEPRIDWPNGVVGTEANGTTARKMWLVDCEPRTDGTVRIVVVTRFPVRPGPELPTVELFAANVPLPTGEHRLSLPPELRPAAGLARRAANGWLVLADGPLRLQETPMEAAAPPTDDDERTPSNGPTVAAVPVGAAVLWLTGLSVLGLVARSGASKWRPEWLASYGALAALVAGWAFAVLAAAGIGWRLARWLRAIGRSVGR
jgi:hypothetical protein